jgi:hypothetical protein
VVVVVVVAVDGGGNDVTWNVDNSLLCIPQLP